jgi:hypothetical protein
MPPKPHEEIKGKRHKAMPTPASASWLPNQGVKESFKDWLKGLRKL